MRIFNVEFKWAFYYLLASLVWTVFEKFMGWHDEQIGRHMELGLFFLIPTLIIYVFAIREKRDTFYDSNMIWMEGLKCGLTLTILMSFLSVPVQWFMSTVVSPDYFINALEYAQEFDGYSLEDAQGDFNLQFFMVLFALKTFLFGIIISAIVSAFIKNG